jgi:hypothetical protein
MVAADARERPERHIRDLARVRYVTSTEYFGELGSFSERGLVDGGHQSCGREHERRGGSGAIDAVSSKSAASGAPTASLVTTGSNSWVLGVGND